MKKGMLLIGLLALGFAEASFGANGSGVGLAKLAGNMQDQASPFLSLAVTFSYVIGFFILLGAIFKFKQHSDDPRQTPMKTPAMLFIVAVLFLGAPMLLGAGGASIFGTGGQSSQLDGSGAENIGFQ